MKTRIDARESFINYVASHVVKTVDLTGCIAVDDRQYCDLTGDHYHNNTHITVYGRVSRLIRDNLPKGFVVNVQHNGVWWDKEYKSEWTGETIFNIERTDTDIAKRVAEILHWKIPTETPDLAADELIREYLAEVKRMKCFGIPVDDDITSAHVMNWAKHDPHFKEYQDDVVLYRGKKYRLDDEMRTALIKRLGK